MATAKVYTTFWDFYPYYLTEHARPLNRAFHFVGTTLFLACIVALVITHNPWWILGMPLAGYSFAWIGHFVFEKNRPATFKYPFYSLGSDFVMYFHTITGQIGNKMKEAHKTVGVV